MKDTRVWIEKELLSQLKNAFSEAKGMTYSGLVDWALRYLLKLQEEHGDSSEEYEPEVENEQRY